MLLSSILCFVLLNKRKRLLKKLLLDELQCFSDPLRLWQVGIGEYGSEVVEDAGEGG